MLAQTTLNPTKNCKTLLTQAIMAPINKPEQAAQNSRCPSLILLLAKFWQSG